MAVPEDRLRQLISLIPRRRIPTIRLQTTAPDAVNETLRVSGSLQRGELAERDSENRQLRELALLRELRSRRTYYRARKKSEQELSDLPMAPVFMTDELVDRAIEQEQKNSDFLENQGLIIQRDPAWEFSGEVRRALGYYTPEERELAARLNDARSNTVFGSIMPNFGRDFAYSNPGAEMDAFRLTSTYLPNALIAGSSIELPSATLAVLSGAKLGWQTTGNLASRAVQAGTQAVKTAAPTITNPRWAASTAAFTVPLAASASNNGDFSSLGFGLGIPVAVGIGAYLTKGKLWGKAPAEIPTESAVSLYVYKPNRGLFTWEYPTSWTRRLGRAVYNQKWGLAADEWNNALGNPTKEQEFITKYNIRESQGVPLYTERQITLPRTYRAVKTETVEEPIMEEVPSSVLDLNGLPVMTKRPKLNTDGTPATRSVEIDVRDINGDLVTYEKPLLDDHGLPITYTYTRREPKLGDDGLLEIVYNPIDRNNVSDFLLGNLEGYTSNLPNIGEMIFRGPTESLKFWAKTRNVGRVASWLGFPMLVGAGIYSSMSSPTKSPTKSNDISGTNTTSSTDSVRYRPFVGVTRDGRVVTEDGDTITPNNYLVESDNYYED